MKLSPQAMYERILSRDKNSDGQFLAGVLSAGIYCLPSCPARKPKFENVRFFASEAEAQATGLRPCKRCRPDLFARDERSDETLFDSLLERLGTEPGAFPDIAVLAATAGLDPIALADLVRAHAHSTPAQLLRRKRVAAVCRGLITGNQRVLDLALEAGFESEAAFHREFLAGTAMTPDAYRALRDGRDFQLQLPDDFRPAEALAYHGRDPEGVFDRVAGRELSIVLRLDDMPALLVIELRPQSAHCTVICSHTLSAQMMAEAHMAAMRMLGLLCDTNGFEARAAEQATVRDLVADRSGLRIPLAPGAFEALVWAVIGQQINLPFAVQLRRALIQLAGEPIGGGRYAHPTPARIAELDLAQLTALRFSRSKAEFLIGAAQAVCTGRIDLPRLAQGSAQVAERALRGIRGLGPWTTHYTLMRGFGLGDCVPVGDSSLSSGLQHLYRLPERPGASETATLMAPFAPHRSLATCHIWASQTKGERA